MAFNPNEHLMKLQTKDYLEVKWRLVWFRELCPSGTIETEIVMLDLDREVTAELMLWNDELRKKVKTLKTAKGYCVCRAIVKDGKGGIGTGTKSESAVDFGDFIEKAESGAIGRALATLGYGTQFTGDELDERHRIVDSPVDREATPATSARTTSNQRPTEQRQSTTNAAPATRTQPAAQPQNGDKPAPVELRTLIAVADKRYPDGWQHLKVEIQKRYKIMAEMTDQLIASEYNIEAQAMIRDAAKQPVAAG